MRIRINPLDPDSIDRAIIKLNEYKLSLQQKTEEIVRRLTVLGGQVVEYYYSAAESNPDFDGVDYEVTCIVNGNSSMIIAEGLDVVFLEFGAGVGVRDDTLAAGMETKGLPPIFPGSYSQLEGSGHFRPGHEYWYYNRHRYESLPAYQGFYFASKEIKEQAVEIAKKVFKK